VQHDPSSKLFKFYDNPSSPRPIPSYSLYPHRDVPLSEFPQNSWQTDDVYVNHFLDEAISLTDRVMLGLVSEYDGYSDLFNIDYAVTTDAMRQFKQQAGNGDQLSRAVGYYEAASFAGLSRRILHAMFTNDDFTVALGGHSAAVGHGNNFNQSSMVQMERILKPYFHNLGVKFTARNMAMGSFGTLESAMAGGGVYGDDNDVIIWDTMMTERSNGGTKTPVDYIDMFYRQAVVSGQKAPFLLQHQPGCAHTKGNVCGHLAKLHDVGGADVGHLWYLFSEVFQGPKALAPKTDGGHPEKLSKSLRWMYVGDTPEEEGAWRKHKCEGICWVDREDGTRPSVKQVGAPNNNRAFHPSCVSWHPGWREHKYKGRLMAYYILAAARTALKQWAAAVTAEGSPLSSDYWHMGEKIEEIKKKTKAMDSSGCEALMTAQFGPKAQRVCNLALTGRTEYTPRVHYDMNLRNMLVGVAEVGVPVEELFGGWDGVPELESEKVEEGEVDVARYAEGYDGGANAVVADGKKEGGDGVGDGERRARRQLRQRQHQQKQRRRLGEGDGKPTLGSLGWSVVAERSGECDGTTDTSCGRNRDYECVLYGHHDGSGGLVGSTASKELLLDLGTVKGGWVGVHVELNEGHHSFELEVVKGEGSGGGESVHVQKVELDVPKIGMPSDRRYFYEAWNDDKSAEGKFLLKVRVTESASFTLTHVYWSVG
jgi:hypothetical protein